MIAALVLLILTGCAPRHTLELRDTREERVCQFAIQAHGRSFAGTMAAVLEGGGIEVAALAPSGTELFRVSRHGDEVLVRAPDPAWIPWLEQLPFERDLPLVFLWDCPVERCSVAGGVVTQRSTGDGGVLRSWRGPGGPASAILHPGKAAISDPRRGYVVTLAGEAIHVP